MLAAPRHSPAPAPLAHLAPRFPRLAAYLAALPDGLGAYPECRARAGILATMLENAPRSAADCDPFVAALLSQPTKGWIPEAVLKSAFLALADLGDMTDTQFLSWSAALWRQLYSGLLYRSLMAMFSPGNLLDRSPDRWASFHHGTQLSIVERQPTQGTAVLTFPRRLYTPLLLEMVAVAFSTALERARGSGVEVRVVESTETSGRFLGRWD